jgi:hypothetical protein
MIPKLGVAFKIVGVRRNKTEPAGVLQRQLEKRGREKGDPCQCQASPQDQRESDVIHSGPYTAAGPSRFGNSIA